MYPLNVPANHCFEFRHRREPALCPEPAAEDDLHLPPIDIAGKAEEMRFEEVGPLGFLEALGSADIDSRGIGHAFHDDISPIDAFSGHGRKRLALDVRRRKAHAGAFAAAVHD